MLYCDWFILLIVFSFSFRKDNLKSLSSLYDGTNETNTRNEKRNNNNRSEYKCKRKKKQVIRNTAQQKVVRAKVVHEVQDIQVHCCWIISFHIPHLNIVKDRMLISVMPSKASIISCELCELDISGFFSVLMFLPLLQHIPSLVNRSNSSHTAYSLLFSIWIQFWMV